MIKKIGEQLPNTLLKLMILMRIDLKLYTKCPPGLLLAFLPLFLWIPYKYLIFFKTFISI